MRVARLFYLLVALVVVSSSFTGSAEAKPTPAQREQAKKLFRAGASAYRVGNFAVAVRAFEQAYAIDPHPATRFSTAQALRRWYAKSEDPAHLRKALTYYREYLAVVKTGGRVLDASRAKNQIEVLLAELDEPAPPEPSGDGDGEGEGPPPTPRRPPPTLGTLMVSGPVVDGSRTYINGKLRAGWPVFAELPPGRHTVRVEAPGYTPFQTATSTIAGEVIPVEVKLEEAPAVLTITANADADILVDGRPVGRTPLSKPLELRSGTHRVVVGTSGHHVFAKDVTVARGQALDLDASLEMTGQRIAAWTFVGVGAVSAGVGVALAVVAALGRGHAQQLRETAENERRPLTLQEGRDYNDALEQRDTYNRAAGSMFGLSALSAGLGLILYLLDDPDLYDAGSSEETARAAPAFRVSPLVLAPDAPPGATISVVGHF
jgi:hypothetical protein